MIEYMFLDLEQGNGVGVELLDDYGIYHIKGQDT